MKPTATQASTTDTGKKSRRANHPSTIKLYPEINTPKVRLFIDSKANSPQDYY
jgi:hypothetical protein